MGEMKLKWTVGLMNSANKFLTAESFQSKVTCNGNTLKKKQIWTLESQGGEVIALKASNDKYLTSDKDGKLDCSGEEVGPDQKFVFETQADGRVAIKSSTYGRYIGGSGDNMTGFDKAIEATNLFTIQLAIHPQVNIKNVNRKTYMHLNEETAEICCAEEIPWGYDATIILEFHEGKYALRAANTHYLSRQGELCEALTKECLYTVVFKGSQVAFQDCMGKYLTALGKTGRVQSHKGSISKDELFELMDSKPQIRLIAAANGKYLSIREGIEVRAKQTEQTDKELFQMEPENNTDFSGNVKWCFRSSNNKFWQSERTITSDAPDASSANTFFTVEWHGPKVALKASNGKYIAVKPNGQMSASADELADNCYFTFKFENRPIIIIRGNYGFVGTKGSSGTLECNRSQYDVFMMTEADGNYCLKGANGKFFKIESDDTLSINGDTPTEFHLELRALSRMVIVAPNGKFLKGQQNGHFTATGEGIDANTLWEY